MSRGVWKAVETSTREIRMGEAEERGSKGGSRKKKGREEEKKEIEKGKNSESSRGMENMG